MIAIRDELAARMQISTQDGFVRKPTTADLDGFSAFQLSSLEKTSRSRPAW